jgi:hypothetical protein
VRTLLLSILLLFAALAGWWLFGALKTKSQYDALLKEERDTSFAVTAMNEQSQALLSEVQRNWRRREDATNISQLLTELGLTPSVTNVIQMLHSPMPRFSFWSPSRVRQAVMVAYMKLAYSDFGTNQTFHVSDDGHLTLLWCSSNWVIVFQDETNGVREAWYSKVK